jgi:small multidrug resistance pump
LVLGFSLISGTGYYLQLLCAVTMPATIMYPIITGGTVALTAVTGAVIFKEKPNFWTLASIILAFIATILFAF